MELRRIRVWLTIFIVGLIVSGVTAFPLEWELNVLARFLGIPEQADAAQLNTLQQWIAQVRAGIHETNARFPFMSYGTDWLAFAHLIIAVLFVGPLRDPVRNLWVMEWGLIACVAVIPLAMICGPLRGIPFYWRLIDCSFGVLGFVPLWICRRLTLQLQASTAQNLEH